MVNCGDLIVPQKVWLYRRGVVQTDVVITGVDLYLNKKIYKIGKNGLEHWQIVSDRNTQTRTHEQIISWNIISKKGKT